MTTNHQHKTSRTSDAPTGHKLFKFISFAFSIAPVGAHQTFFQNNMKILHSLLLVFVIGLSALSAKEATPFPDLSKALPTENLSKQVKLAGFELYMYATDFEFAKLKKKFSGFLGADWTEVKLDPKSQKRINEAAELAKAEGGAMEGCVIFSNPEFPGTHITMQQMKKKSESKTILVITVIRK